MILLDEKLGTKCQLGFIFAVAKALAPPTAPVCHGTPADGRGAHVLWLMVAPACKFAADSVLGNELLENFRVCSPSSFG